MTIEQIEEFGLTINEELLQRLGVDSVEELCTCARSKPELDLIERLEELDELKPYFAKITKYYDSRIGDFEDALTLATATIAVAINDKHRAESEKFFVSYVKSRIKTLKSLKEKCWRKGLMPNEISTGIYDIAGARIILDYVDKIDAVREALHDADGFSWSYEEDEDGGRHEKHTKNYIDHPKENGYRGFHLTPEVIVKHKHVPVEIQIRTNGQNLWASMEHKLNFKPIFPGSIDEEEQRRQFNQFKEAAELLAALDKIFVDIRNVRTPDKVVPKENDSTN